MFFSFKRILQRGLGGANRNFFPLTVERLTPPSDNVDPMKVHIVGRGESTFAPEAYYMGPTMKQTGPTMELGAGPTMEEPGPSIEEPGPTIEEPGP